MDNESARLTAFYEQYISCLNRRSWSELSHFVHEQVIYNNNQFTLSDYRSMLENDVKTIPDLYFHIKLLVTSNSTIASKIAFNCTPVATLWGNEPNGRTIAFDEHVFYRIEHGKICQVDSLIDKAAVREQLLEKTFMGPGSYRGALA